MDDIAEEVRRVSYAPAGAILMKRSAIEEFGFQDETLNMYCDERDMAIRLQHLGYEEAVTKRAVAWHQHVNRNGENGRNLFAPFYSSRNRIYIVRKHANVFYASWVAFKVFIYEFGLVGYHFVRGEKKKIKADRAVISGTRHGLFRQMDTFPLWLASD